MRASQLLGRYVCHRGPAWSSRVCVCGAAGGSASMQHPHPIVIAVDGPAASGKGTLAARLAARLGLAHLDTGRLYRAAALKALQRGVSLDDQDRVAAVAAELHLQDVANPSPQELVRLHSEATGSAASRISSLPAVRAAVGALPRAFIRQCGPGCVMDGRDVGTVLAPEAQLKLFITASAEARAHRRWAQLHATTQSPTGADITLESVLQGILERDARDSSRDVAPLQPAADAVIIDTSHLDADAVLAEAMRWVAIKLPGLAQQP